MTFKSCAEVLGARVAWTVASIGKLISDGRAEGWLEGAALQAVDPRELHATVAALLAATPVDVRIAPIDWLAHRLSLKRVELDALWLLICCEIDPAVSRLVRSLEASGDLSIQLWQRLVSIATGEHLDNAHLENLFDWVLVETSFDAAIPLQRRAVRASDRVVELATGELRLDRKVARFASMLDALEREGEPLAHGQVVVAVGKVGSGRATKLRRAYGRPVLDVRVAGSAIDARQLAALCREAALFGAAPLFRELPAGNDELAKLIDEHVLRSFKGLVLATASETPTWIGERCVITTTKALTRDERQSVWKHHLPAAEETTLSELADRYSVGPGMIAKVSATVGADATIDSLHTALRHHLSNSVAELATKIEITQTWDDLVLPSDQFEQVIELVARVRHRRQVLDTWGFGAKVGKANGVATLLSGPPGTGKTMVAGLIAKELERISKTAQ